MPKYPNITIDLVGEDGNAFSIMGRVTRALRTARVPQSEVDVFREEAMSGDYGNLLRTVLKWVAINDSVDEDDDYVDNEGEGCWNCGEGESLCSCDCEDN